jgi:hypothetical protein
MIKTRWGKAVAGAVVVGTVGAFALGASGIATVRLDRVVFVPPEPAPAWTQRLAVVDAALERSDLSRAIYEWREAYGAAVRAKRSEALIAVADRAVRIAKLGGGSGYFLTEARYIYLHAAGRARAERSPEAILGIAEAFDKLGDAERASQVRRLAEQLS